MTKTGSDATRAGARRSGVAIAAFFFLALFTWSVSSPVGSGPDDDVHIAALYCASGRADCSMATMRVQPCFARDPGLPATCESVGDDRLPVAGQFAVDYYPGLYSRIMSGFLGDTVARSTLNVRLANCLLAMVLLSVSLRVCRPEHKPAVLLGWMVGALPLTMFMVASINPNAWTVIGVAALWGPLLGALLDGRVVHWGRIAVIVLSVLLVVGSRNEGFLLLAVVGGALGVYVLATGPPQRAKAGVLVLFLFGVAITLMRAVVVVPEGPGRPVWQTLIMGASVPFESQGSGVYFPWQLGWLDTPLPPFAGMLSVAIYSGVCLVGLGRLDRPKGLAVLTFWVLFTAAACLAWVVKYPLPVQPRYLLPLIMMGAGLALIPARETGPLLATPSQLWLAAAGLSLVNSLGLLYLTLRFLVGLPGESTIAPGPYYPGPMELLGAATPDWWLGFVGPTSVFVLGSAAYVGGAIAVVLRLQHSLRSEGPVCHV